QHAVDGGVAGRIIAEPSCAELLEPLDVAAQLLRIAVPHRVFDSEGHTGALQLGDAFEHGGAAIRGDAGGRAADRNGAGTRRVAGGKMQGDRAADGYARERNLAGDANVIE